MPAFRLGRNRGLGSAKLVYRIGSSRDNSPLIARLGISIRLSDELHTNDDIGAGISETTFEGVETPHGLIND